MPQSNSDADLIVRNGLIVDGTGGEPYAGDVAIKDGKIIAVGKVSGSAKEELDATGCIVTPGFVDLHTHYDGHVLWDTHLKPSSNHGVTTALIGNCGVGFAPCKPETRPAMLNFMEGVEDIPKEVMEAGLAWNWESFPEYLDAVADRHLDMDVAAHIGHIPLRAYVMGQRGIDREPATPEEIEEMGRIVEDAVRAGAIGFSTSRTSHHQSRDGKNTAGLTASEEELVGIAKGVQRGGGGAIQLITDFKDHEGEFALIEAMARESGCSVSFTMTQKEDNLKRHEKTMEMIEKANAEGLEIRGQVLSRPTTTLFGLTVFGHPFTFSPSYQAIAHLPLAERVAEMKKPEVRKAILDEFPTITEHRASKAFTMLDRIYELKAVEPELEPFKENSLAAIAEKLGVPAKEYAYDRLIADDGLTMFMLPSTSMIDVAMDAIERMMKHPNTVLALGDGGAHSTQICDASAQTYMLTRWIKGRHGRSISLTEGIKMITLDPAVTAGMLDRGVIKVGYKGDLNVIDMDNITLYRPLLVKDMPAGAGRVIMPTTGYRATIVSGEITRLNDQETGRLPGRLIRGRQPAPTPTPVMA
ncbi:N-acyl-D-aspartate/D-glutamate deacylase [Novosphingobium sp. CF614]|uniref:N-acyl-D-amino-acid deacylase family protein n=1 Tax=Novosphingobium sp. CF614 TaxID=1884364 RepID=UPI0008DF2580|nr:amidohydrolase family protein [Novosphingobium sp. CF614]SFF77532.1 N-acyl-D-aspartate/D-glutamate deacylase [Novosphingobium sp. CF614]